MPMASENDIKAPDGFLLGGLRRVRADRTVLFQRGWWGPLPVEWIGKKVWVHIQGQHFYDGRGEFLQVAPPGAHIYQALLDRTAVKVDRTDRDDAAPVFRDPVTKAWIARHKLPA
jgi:hypothetical protein